MAFYIKIYAKKQQTVKTLLILVLYKKNLYLLTWKPVEYSTTLVRVVEYSTQPFTFTPQSISLSTFPSRTENYIPRVYQE